MTTAIAMSSAETALWKRAEAAVAALYAETDVPPPSLAIPIAPLGPLLERLAVRCVEQNGLTGRGAESYLHARRILREGLPLGDDADMPLAGFLYAAGEAAFLFVEAGNPVVRRRFSIAHELGHFVLHLRPALRRWQEDLAAGADVSPGLYDAFRTTDSDRAEEGDGDTGYDQREREADAFSAALLMPEPLTRARVDLLRRERPSLSDTGLADRMAMDFLVSRQAMRRRLSALGLTDAPLPTETARILPSQVPGG